MPILDTVAVLVAAAVFAYLYATEKGEKGYQVVFRYTWLFVALTLVAVAFAGGSYLTSTSTATALNGTVTTTYNYTSDPFLNAFAVPLGILIVFAVLVILYRMVDAIRT